MLTVECPNCGKSYQPKPELAGKKVKCKCGAVMKVPADEDLPDNPYDIAPTQEEEQQKEKLKRIQRAGTCPSCGEKIVKGAILCVACGFNFQTGKKLNTMLQDQEGAVLTPGQKKATARRATGKTIVPGAAKPKAAGGAKASLPSRGTVSTGKHDEMQKENVKKIAIGLVILLVLVGASVAALNFLGGGDDAAAVNIHEDDKFMQDKFDAGGVLEAREWIKSGLGGIPQMIGGMNERQSESRINSFYEMGAVKVWAYGAQMTLSVTIELPQDPESRKKLFDWQAEWHTDRRETVRTDVGQKYLRIHIPNVPN